MFESCTQLWGLVTAFRSGSIAPADFRHRHHLAVAAHYLRTHPETQCLATTANGFVERFADKSLIERHYPPALLFSDEARANWIAPDRLAMP